ncbi:MAG: 4'-phosphopantetheinyl transferase superfamily protein, partial [bacterium]|nr:4'-phosphopantetheinyl transferase superfamily protein [bacterium]
LDIPYDFFSEDEHHELMNKRDKLSYFFTLWTIKESYVKIIGKGMSFPLHNVSCRFVSEDRIVLNSPDGKTINGVSFAQYNIHSDYKMFLCATHDGFPPQVKKRNIDSLIRDFLV